METAGLIIAANAGAAIFVVGLCYLFTPQAMAASFGLTHLPQQSATAWLRVKGVRDTATGVVAAVLLAVAEPAVVAWCVLAFTLIPVGDTVLVLSNGGKRAVAWGIHGSTAVLMMLSVGLILGGS